MAEHDKRYKRILTHRAFAYDVARLLADEFNLGTVDRESLSADPTSSVRESERERITDCAWSFDTERQRTVMMIVEAQSARQRHLAIRLLRYVVDRLLELCEDPKRLQAAEGLPPANGQRYSLSAGIFFEIDDGLISRVTTYYNLADWIAQVEAGDG